MTTPAVPPPPAPRGGIDRGALLVGVASLVLIGGFVFALWKIAPPPPPDLGPEAHVLTVPLDVPEFALTDHRGKPFDRDRLLGRWSLLFFGYTYCPDICPVTLSKLAPVLDLLGPDSEVQAVFVSVDPERDGTERLAEYVTFFHPALIGASGDEAEIARLTEAIGVFHQKRAIEAVGGERADGYLVDHSSSLFLVDPSARLHAILHEPDDPEAFVELLARARRVERDPD
jgi:protein SCO1/2